MSDNIMVRVITRALLSVSDKTGIVELASLLEELGVDILSTGGTSALLREKGIKVRDISEHTGFPEIMDGRVKTLHPKVHGGLLACLDDPKHVQAMEENAITPIDLVVVNLYPFEATVAKGAEFAECIENIDIGGPSMIRSAAKNHRFTTVVTDPGDYAALMETLTEQKGTSEEFRKGLAAKAFGTTARYDAAISNWFAKEEKQLFPSSLTVAAHCKQVLRYGENPHQQAALYVTDSKAVGIANAEQLQGKELSYNNINDADAALELVSEFSDPAAVIIKHANPCGAATSANLVDAYDKALASDPVSAFGGIIAFNRKLDRLTAEKVSKLFAEVIIAPEIEDEARVLLAAKKNLRVLLTHGLPDPANPAMLVKSINGGLLLQERDHAVVTRADLTVITKRAPSEEEFADLLFAFKLCKHVKSNAIVFAKNQATIGVGAGQMSRVDSVRMAALKAAEGEGNKDRAKGAVVASDAFFPFPDGLILAAEAGVTAAIHPGGSVRDEEVIAAADARGIAMVVTGKRHFKH